MTTVYIPRRIETVADAEGLPVGTIARWANCVRPDLAMVAVKVVPNAWDIAGTTRGLRDADMPSDDETDVTALVPVEAEEEDGEKAVAEGEFVGITRLFTPWEDA